MKDKHAQGEHVLGMALSARGDYAAAEEKFAAALRIYGELRAESEAAKTRYEFGKMLLAKGNLAKGKATVETALAVFARLGMRGWQEKCRKALAGSTR